MLPADQLAVGVEPGFEPVVVHRPVETAVDVVLAGPLQLHRHAVGAQRLGDRYRLDDIVRPGVGAPAEAAAGVERIDLHLLRLQPGGARRVALVDGLELVAGPDLAAVGGQPDHRVQRLHRRMGEERELVAGGDPAGRPGHRLGGVAVPARGLAGLLGELAVLRHQRLGTTLLGLALVPLDLERVAALLRRPEALGDHRHAVRHLDHLDHPRNRPSRRGVERFHRGAEQRRALEQGDQHAGQADVEGELRTAVGLAGNVDARRLVTDQAEVLGILQLHFFRHRQFRRRSGQRTVAGLALAGRMFDEAVAGAQFGGRHSPLAGGGLDQHRARLGPGLAQLHPGVGHRRTAAGALHGAEGQVGVALGVGGRAFHADLAPVRVEFLGDDGGDTGIGTLAHLHVLGDHRDTVVRGDPQEGVGREAGVRQGRGEGTPGSAPLEADGQADHRGAFEEAAARAGQGVAQIDLAVHGVRPSGCRRLRGWRRGSAHRRRSGRCCRSSRHRCRRRWGWRSAPAARWRT
ncbi:hypothetical protein PAERUG_E10_London_26_VIM_2_06_13_01156 [Pseudomonas aeruginosa]|nr:hypothetical protein PAERUG_E10_London_26_VIM_2_06_13_01156 [Pseudomonas aeruginosa]CRQ75452.1 hypothetical protein PAERUG_E5_London_17_VIM_2_12_12_04406 [Pseudomonas aeruginosa]CRW97483.1 hypothetical protein PAERUG_P53_London_9_VIM_2_02_13_03122 [Pseudomonas aeruginosa]